MGKTIYSGVQSAFGSGGSPFGPRTTVTAGITTKVPIPAGVHLVECDANSSVQFSYDGGTTWVTWIAASGVGMVFSDGFNTVFLGGASAGSPKRSQILAM
jgi:hypothetical protein